MVPSKPVAFTTSELIESAGAPIFSGLSSFSLLVPATTKMMSSNSDWSSSSIAASGDTKLREVPTGEPRERFHTLMSLLSLTMPRILRMTANELKRPAFATQKCRTRNLPQLSSSLGLMCGPSTMSEVTDVPCNLSCGSISPSAKTYFDSGVSTHLEK